MAAARKIVCDGCQHELVAWDDGNPYYVDERGTKHYAYHPDHEALTRCIGNDHPHLCLSCGTQLHIDSRAPIAACPKCHSPEIVATSDLDGRPCPYCKHGSFRIDADFFAIS